MRYVMGYTLMHVVATIIACGAELNGREYAKSKKIAVEDFHRLFASSALESERQATEQVTKTAQGMESAMESSLAMMTYSLRQELDTAEVMAQGTSAQVCLTGIASCLDNAITSALNGYKDCSSDMTFKNSRLYNNLRTTIANYQTTYDRTIVGIDNCANAYPNEASTSRLKICVDSWSNKYFTVATNSMFNTTSSPSMKQFLRFVGVCAEVAANHVIDEGWKFIRLLARCSKLSENIYFENYEIQLNASYSKSIREIDLVNQTLEAQEDFSKKEIKLETDMTLYNTIQKSIYSNYMVGSRNESYYARQISNYLQQYSSTIASTSSDNPAQTNCIITAQRRFSQLITLGSQEGLKCDQNIVNQTRILHQVVNTAMTEMNIYRQTYGNPAILTCYSQGYIFANGVISRCYQLFAAEFSIKIAEANDTIVKHMGILKESLNLLSNRTVIPCAKYVVDNVKLEADRNLFDLQRCMYSDSGTNYAVTTPSTTATSTSKYEVTYSPM